MSITETRKKAFDQAKRNKNTWSADLVNVLSSEKDSTTGIKTPVFSSPVPCYLFFEKENSETDSLEARANRFKVFIVANGAIPKKSGKLINITSKDGLTKTDIVILEAPEEATAGTDSMYSAVGKFIDSA
jgi:hypothetical protein